MLMSGWAAVGRADFEVDAAAVGRVVLVVDAAEVGRVEGRVAVDCCCCCRYCCLGFEFRFFLPSEIFMTLLQLFLIVVST